SYRARGGRQSKSFSRGTTKRFAAVRSLGGADCCVNLAMLFQPAQLVALGAFLDFAKELHRFGFVAWLTRIVRRDDPFNLDRDDISFRLNQSRPFNALAGNPHD